MIKEFVNNKTDAMKAVARKVKDAVIDKTSDVLSAPKRAIYDAKTRASDRAYNNTIKAREEKYKKEGGPRMPQEEAIKRKTVQIGTSTPAIKQYGDKGYNPVSKSVEKN